MHFDGDGPDAVQIDGIDHDKNKDEVNALSGYGGDFEIIGDYGAWCARSKGDAKEVYNPKAGNLFKSLGDNMDSQTTVLFFKSYVKPHTRKLASGRVINVGGYNNKKLAHGKEQDSRTGDMFVFQKKKKGTPGKKQDSSSVKNIKEGDTVKLKPEYMDEGEDSLTFVAVDDIEKGRVSIKATDSGLNFPPVNTVQDYMIEGHPDKKKPTDSRIPAFDVKNATQESADKWIAELHEKGLLYHFDDDPAEVINKDGRTFTDEEAKALQPIVDAIFEIEKYDPFETSVKLSN